MNLNLTAINNVQPMVVDQLLNNKLFTNTKTNHERTLVVAFNHHF